MEFENEKLNVVKASIDKARKYFDGDKAKFSSSDEMIGEGIVVIEIYPDSRDITMMGKLQPNQILSLVHTYIHQADFLMDKLCGINGREDTKDN